jgi:hypothetical protein
MKFSMALSSLESFFENSLLIEYFHVINFFLSHLLLEFDVFLTFRFFSAKVGKTSLITSLVSDVFQENVGTFSNVLCILQFCLCCVFIFFVLRVPSVEVVSNFCCSGPTQSRSSHHHTLFNDWKCRNANSGHFLYTSLDFHVFEEPFHYLLLSLFLTQTNIM